MIIITKVMVGLISKDYYMKRSERLRRNQLKQKTANQMDLLLVNGNEFMLWMVLIRRIGKLQRLI